MLPGWVFIETLHKCLAQNQIGMKDDHPAHKDPVWTDLGSNQLLLLLCQHSRGRIWFCALSGSSTHRYEVKYRRLDQRAYLFALNRLNESLASLPLPEPSAPTERVQVPKKLVSLRVECFLPACNIWSLPAHQRCGQSGRGCQGCRGWTQGGSLPPLSPSASALGSLQDPHHPSPRRRWAGSIPLLYAAHTHTHTYMQMFRGQQFCTEKGCVTRDGSATGYLWLQDVLFRVGGIIKHKTAEHWPCSASWPAAGLYWWIQTPVFQVLYLIWSLVMTSRLDNCSAILDGCPNNLKMLQSSDPKILTGTAESHFSCFTASTLVTYSIQNKFKNSPYNM